MELEKLIESFFVLDYRIQIIIGINSGLAILSIVLHLFLYWSYQFPLLTFRLSKRDIEKKEDIKSTASFLLNRITKDYLRAAEKGLGNIKTDTIIEKYLNRMHFFGWNLRNMANFLKGIEKSSIFIGILGTFWISFMYEELTNKGTYGNWIIITAGVSFLIVYLVGSLFSYETPRAKIRYELEEYLDHQYGSVYVQDTVSTINLMRSEMKEIQVCTSEELRDTIEQLSKTITETYMGASAEMTKKVEDTMKQFSSFGEIIEAPLIEWRKALVEAKNYQEEMESVILHFKNSIKNFEKAAETLREELLSHEKEVQHDDEQRRAMINHIEKILEGTQQLLKDEQSRSEGMSKQIEFIGSNQEIVNVSLQRYQESIENIGKGIGEVLGNTAQFQGQKIVGIMEQSLDQVMDRWLVKNFEVLEQIQKSIEKMNFYNKQLSQRLIDLRDEEND